ncbi:hypothetical protein QBC33DRAFT_324418 [Phialemonium atrogriseum]|uniref:Uncharacterized protein n=1 Tax=Phialemonium atrogriseum TaxID=1093897 RepID=A0AAJ0FJ45_9PEZI|nr:uncharacterized protein QBC33DRAFT_324418 [Phialemonium atrogriseum]KAK1769527.1 hypothetical protein QBC33DRAFT_324418 [Phialemonium atrogriseum]
MESIQLAQMLADLSDLNAAQEAEAALALVNANKALPPPHDASKPLEQDQLHHQRPASASAIISWTSSSAKFDKFGRRILTPPMTRSNSSMGPISGTSTPRGESQAEDDVARATSLMQLYEIRAQLRQQDTTGLNRARERINAIQARQHQQMAHTPEKRETSESSQTRFTYPKAP